MSKKFSKITSLAVPLPIKDVDTDMIIPAQYLTSISRKGYGKALFSNLKQSDPTLLINDARFKESKILISDSNFGCGSSREHAVWALQEAGFSVIIGKSFADIFTSNSGKNGLLLIKLAADQIDLFLGNAKHGDLILSVDLEEQIIQDQKQEIWKFDYDPFLKECLLRGIDEMDYILGEMESIRRHKGLNGQTVTRSL